MIRYRIAITSEVIDVEGFRATGRVRRESGTVEVKLAIVSVKPKTVLNPVDARDIASLIKTYVKEVLTPQNDEVVAISGRMPLWLAMIVQHELQHIVPALAVFDPKLGGAVVTAVHRWGLAVDVGDTVELDQETVKTLTQ